MSFLRHILVWILTASFIAGPAAPYAWAGPVQSKDKPGNGLGSVNQTGPTSWDVNVHNGAILQYSSFDVAVNEIVHFNGLDNGADVRVLNRILGTAASHIDGTLAQSGGNIHVYFVNPAGVFFGPNAQINVTALQAAAGTLSDDDFKNGKDRYTGLKGPVENAGRLNADSVALAGAQVSNTATGAIGSGNGTVVLVSGGNVLIRPDGVDRGPGSSDSVANAGTLNGQRVDLVGGSVSNSGTVAASNVSLAAAQQVTHLAGSDSYAGVGGSVENTGTGTISASDAQLVGGQVTNSAGDAGKIDADRAVLASGGSVVIRPDGIDRAPSKGDSVANAGTINGHQIDLAGSAVTNFGTIAAADAAGDPGSVSLSAGRHVSHLDDGERFAGGRGTVDNTGTVSGSQVRMVGGDVTNSGEVDAGEAVLAAGRNVRLGSDGDDKYKTMTGSVANTGKIIADAVSLVGGKVTNGEQGQVTAAEGGWIVIAAGHDVFIGRDDTNQGVLLRVEGGAKALDPTATGITNAGALTAGSSHNPYGTGKITLGAADLYGQAIFNTGAIEARRVALQADNGGNIALGGQIHADTADVTFAGAKPGELRGTGGGTQTLNADTVNLTATDAKGSVKLGKGLALRGNTNPDLGPPVVTVHQQATLNTSNLTGLDIGPDRARTNLQINSTGGSVVVDDKNVVAGTDLDLQGRTIQLKGTNALEVDSLLLNSITTVSEGDIVATGSNGINAATNLFLITKPGAKKDPTQDFLISAHQGTLDVAGDVVTSNGGGLRIEAKDVELGSVSDASGALNSGTVQSSGGVQSRIQIGFTDENGVQQTNTVTMNGINSFGARANEKDPKVAGGDVIVNANGDVTIRGTIDSMGESNASKITPDESGGSVTIHSGGTLTVGSVQTGGADAPAAGAPERGAISLSASKIIAGGNLTAQATPTANADGSRDRSVKIDGELELAADSVHLLGGDVTVTGPMHSGSHTDPNTSLSVPFATDVTVGASRTTDLGPVEGGIKSLTIDSSGGDVITRGDIVAPFGVTVAFTTPRTGVWKTGGETITVSTNQASVSAHDSSDPKSTTAAVSLDPNIHFLQGVPDPTGNGAPPTFSFSQDAAIDSAKTSEIFSAGRFGPSLDGSTISLASPRSGVTLDAQARDALRGADVRIIGTDFAATELGGTGPDFDVASLALSIQHAIDMNFSVVASKSILINSGTDGKGEGITLESTLRADSISIAASDGQKGSTKGAITFGAGALLLASNGDAAKQVTLTQDADFSTASVPKIFGTPSDPNSPLDLALESLDGTLTLADATQFAPSTKLTLFGAKAVDLGTQAIQLGSFSASTNGDLNVTNPIGTGTGGSITLHAGAGDGTGNLTVSSALSSNEIDLIAGNPSGTGNAHVVLDGAHFSGVSADSPLTHFTIEQSAAITSLPDLSSDFTNRASNMLLTLQSNDQNVKLTDANAVQGLGLQLGGKNGVELDGNFDVASLESTGLTTLDGNVTAHGDVLLHGAVTLSSAATAGTQSIRTDGGALTVDAALKKQNGGDIDLGASGALTVASVDTAHFGGSITINGHDSVTTGALNSRAQASKDAAGDPVQGGGNVTVSSSGNIEIASIDATGFAGEVPQSHTDATNGGAAGSVSVKVVDAADPNAKIAIGTVNASGGDGGNPSTSQSTSTTGGAAGSITLQAVGGVDLRGDLLADGGLDGVLSTGTTTPATRPPERGAAGAVSITGDVRLGVDTGVTAAGNRIHGSTVSLAGDVVPGSDKNGNAVTPADTALGVVAYAKNGLTLGGSVAAGKIDLEQRGGTLRPSAGQTTLSADTIRLAASDGQDGDTTGTVDLGAFVFRASDGTIQVGSLTLEQDASFGEAGSAPIPRARDFDLGTGTRANPLGLGLISHDGTIDLSAAQAADLAGTDLVLASNSPTPIEVRGDLTTHSLTLGTTTALGATGGTTEIQGNLVTGSTDPSLSFQQALSMAGDLTVHGNASILGSSAYTGTDKQTLLADGTLLMTGLSNVKSLNGDLTFTSNTNDIQFGDGSQSFGDAGGALTFSSSLLKKKGDLVLGGQVQVDPNSPTPDAVVIKSTPLDGFPGRSVALAALDGSVVVNAATAPEPNTPGTGTGPGTGTYDIRGDVLAFGDLSLNGRAKLSGESSYTFQALRSAEGKGGTLTVGGIESTDGPVTLRGEGPRATPDQPDPSAVKLSGDFAVSQLDVEGTSEIASKTTITGQNDVTFNGPIHGAGDLSVVTKGAVLIGDDVGMTGAFAVGGDQGVRFVEDSDVQTIEAVSIALGNGAAGAADGLASLSRTGDETSGDLTLRATKGDVQMALGQRLIVNGNLDVTASGGILLADTAALSVHMTSKELSVHGGSTVAANSILTSAKPRVAGGGGVTFAVPTGNEISQTVPSDNVLVRKLNATGTPLTSDDLVAGIFPSVSGAAIFDYARNIPELLPRAPLTRPMADPMALDAALEARPLWAEELLAYLERRSVESRAATGKPAEAELLPPVGARPGEPLNPNDTRVRGAAAENAVALYREVFRPDLRRDPETGVIDAPSHSAEIRAAFQQPIDTLRRARHGQEVTGQEVAKLVQTDVKYSDARRYREQLGALLDVGSRALTPDQRPRFRGLLLAEVTPYGISQAEFSSLFE